ncbi:MAG: hypothetical protein KatS3mg014_1827 [Actinomycetota bacterium]|nr:MAG: hypothetical protein KatS3mg014_1827 [Actinomycetota bacterium]
MDPLSQNRYAYAADDPITLSDPTGLKAKSGGTSPHCGRPCQEHALATAEQRYAEASAGGGGGDSLGAGGGGHPGIPGHSGADRPW